jgi:hypothetical protein
MTLTFLGISLGVFLDRYHTHRRKRNSGLPSRFRWRCPFFCLLLALIWVLM